MDDSYRRAWPLPFGERPELDFRSGHGDVVLAPLAPGEEPHLSATGYVEIHASRAGNIVHVAVDRDGHSRRGYRSEDTHIAVYVPRDLRAHVRAAAGSIEAHDLGPCELVVQSGAGRIALSDVYGRLRLSLGAGQVAGHGLGGSFDIETNAGAVLLQIEALDPGEHHISSGAGAVRLELARDLDVRVEVRSYRGASRNDFPARPHAAAVLYVSADSCSVRAR